MGSIGPTKCKKNVSSDINLLFKNMVSMATNEAILKTGDTTTKIIIAPQQLILGYKTWYQINALA